MPLNKVWKSILLATLHHWPKGCSESYQVSKHNSVNGVSNLDTLVDSPDDRQEQEEDDKLECHQTHVADFRPFFNGVGVVAGVVDQKLRQGLRDLQESHLV